MSFGESRDEELWRGQCVYVKDPSTVGHILKDSENRNKEVKQYCKRTNKMVVKVILQTGSVITAAAKDVHPLAGVDCQVDYPVEPVEQDDSELRRKSSLKLQPKSPFDDPTEVFEFSTRRPFNPPPGHLRSPHANNSGIAASLPIRTPVESTKRAGEPVATAVLQKANHHGVSKNETNDVVEPEKPLEAGARYTGIGRNHLADDNMFKDHTSSILSTAETLSVQQKIVHQKMLEATEDEEDTSNRLARQQSLAPTSPISPQAIDPNTVIHQGVVTKNGNSFFSTWYARKFVLTGDHKLRYYDGRTLKGEIDLRTASSVYCVEKTDCKGWNIETKGRKYQMKCDDPEKTQEWIAVVDKAIQGWVDLKMKM